MEGSMPAPLEETYVEKSTRGKTNFFESTQSTRAFSTSHLHGYASLIIYLLA
jgi:hypothetical protein